MAFRFHCHLNAGTLDDVIPRDYVHVFLIRDPALATASFYKMTLDMGLDLLAQARAGEHALSIRPDPGNPHLIFG